MSYIFFLDKCYHCCIIVLSFNSAGLHTDVLESSEYQENITYSLTFRFVDYLPYTIFNKRHILSCYEVISDTFYAKQTDSKNLDIIKIVCHLNSFVCILRQMDIHAAFWCSMCSKIIPPKY